jgi:F0F1-type ATP synthase membrane subunit c/vacuolar-type H+-ATPase subunit K
MDLLNYVWPGLAVWLAWIWVAIGQWILAKKAMEVMWKSPKMVTFYLTVTILGIALIESAVIYWLVVAFQLLAAEGLPLYSSIWAWLAIWLAWLGAWIWEWQLIAWALSAMDKNPAIKGKIMTFMVLFVALVEVTAIYGLIIAFKIIWSEGLEPMFAMWAWLAIWLAWVWVAIWRWYMSEKALEVMGQNPKMISFFLTVSILWVALIESAAIYALIVAFQILSFEWTTVAAVWAWLAIWLAWLGAWIWEWQLIAWALNAMNRNPEIKGKIMTFMVLFVALVEVTAIYGLIISFKILDLGDALDPQVWIWAWLAIWLAWVWVAIWRWYMSERSLEVMGQNPKMISFFLTISILWVALIESAAIYALIVAFQILSFEWAVAAAIGSGLAIWFAWLGAWVGEWLLIKWAMWAINTSPETKGKIMAFMVLFVALIEVVAIYGLIISFKVLG